MNRIKDAFKNKKALIPFITGGDPNLEITKKLIIEMQDAGADLIEIGIPFSDPIAEEQVIQNSYERSLKNGCTNDKLFDAIKEVKEQIRIPMVLMTYINAIYAYGKESFMKKCTECGIAGIIVSDMPFEEKEELLEVCHKYNIKLISSVAPTSSKRIKMIAKEAEGFLYCASSFGITKVKDEIKTNIEMMIKKAREVTDIPCAIGLDTLNAFQSKEMITFFDGMIIDSEIVKIIAKYKYDCIPYVVRYIKEIKEMIEGL